MNKGSMRDTEQEVRKCAFVRYNVDNKKELKRFIVEKSFYDNDEIIPIVYQQWRNLLDDKEQEEFVDAIFQYDDQYHKYIDIYDAFYYATIKARVLQGEIAYFKLQIGFMPECDEEKEENQRNISKGLMRYSRFYPSRGQFKAVVNPEKGREARKDGTLEMVSPIIVKYKGRFIKLLEKEIPLEIGTTDAITTYLHLHEEGSVARWPYGSESITILIDLTSNSINKETVEDIDTIIAVQ